MLLMRGTQKHTRQQIQDELDKIKTRLMPTPAGVNAARFGFETTRENLPAAMRLLSEVLREPTYPENEFDQAKQASLASYEQALRDPQAMGSSVLRQHVTPYAKGDIRRTRLPEEELEEIKATTLADVKKFYTRFLRRIELGVEPCRGLRPAGNEDARQATCSATGRALRSMRACRTNTSRSSRLKRTIETPDKANAYFT